MEDKLKKLQNGRQTQSLANGRQPGYFCKWKTTSICLPMENNIKIVANGRWPQCFSNGRQPQYSVNGRHLDIFAKERWKCMHEGI